MTLKDLIEKLDLAVCCGGDRLSRTVTGGYAGDLLSDVIANSRSGDVWITMQVHVNTVAVAVLKDLAAIILVNGRTPAPDTKEKAMEEKVTILTSARPAFDVAGRLYGLGIGSGP